jgi:hypothetical protein
MRWKWGWHNNSVNGQNQVVGRSAVGRSDGSVGQSAVGWTEDI